MRTTASGRIVRVVALASVAALVLSGCSSDDAGDEVATETAEATEATADNSSDDSEDGAADGEAALFASVPEVPNATQTGQEDIQEGGVHIYGTVTDAPAESVEAYSALLEKNDWTIEGSGGDPSGESGAGVQATHSDGRYLSYNVGGAGQGTSFGDLCLWPSKPDDTNCPQNQQNQQCEQGDQGDSGGGPPAGVEGFIPDEVEQFIP